MSTLNPTHGRLASTTRQERLQSFDERYRQQQFVRRNWTLLYGALFLAALIGSVAFSGSCVAYAKLQGIMKKAYRFPAQNQLNIGLAAVVAILGLAIATAEQPGGWAIVLFSCCRWHSA